MADQPEERESCLSLCDDIRVTISQIGEKLGPVLTADPEEDKRIEEATSPMRDKLAGILTKLNILSSRINL